MNLANKGWFSWYEVECMLSKKMSSTLAAVCDDLFDE